MEDFKVITQGSKKRMCVRETKAMELYFFTLNGKRQKGLRDIVRKKTFHQKLVGGRWVDSKTLNI